MLLDLELGDGNGLDVLRQLGPENELAVIVVSGRTGEADRVSGLELGADDYITKPFLPRELVARIRGAPPPKPGDVAESQREVMVFGRLTIDNVAKEARVDDKSVMLTAREFELLHFWPILPGRVWSHDQILERVWGSAEWSSGATVSEHVHRVRRKLDVDGSVNWLDRDVEGRRLPVRTGAGLSRDQRSRRRHEGLMK